MKVRALLSAACGVGPGVAFLAALSALCLFGQSLSLGDRLAHFPFYWALLALGLFVRASYIKRRMLAALAAALFLVHAVPVVSLWLRDSPPPARSEKHTVLTVVSANLYAHNSRKPEALAKLTNLSPDVLVLLELGDEWQAALKPLLEKYPHNFGTQGTTWMLSRHPLRMAARTEMKVADSARYDVLLEATVLAAESAIRVVAIHPPPPRGSDRVAQQRLQAADYALALQRDEDATHRMLIGDFNTTPFSAVFRHIVQTTGLRNAGKGRGYHPTWGPGLPDEPLLPWLGIPIDHALVSDEVLVDDWMVGEMPGSDHRYQRLRLRF
jgi:endonuclease/exonuclease/phosphatase (EEP) superfamily protein YafD